MAALGLFRGKDGGNWLEGPKSADATAMAGRLDLAGPTARQVLEGGAMRDPTSPERAFMAAIVAASDSRSGAVPPDLLAIADHPQVWYRFPGNVLLGHYLRARGDCPGAIVAYERARAVPWHWLVGEKPALFPFVLHSLALCYETVGDLAKARERNAEMLRLWANADPDIPLLAEAKATRAWLVAAGRTRKVSKSQRLRRFTRVNFRSRARVPSHPPRRRLQYCERFPTPNAERRTP